MSRADRARRRGQSAQPSLTAGVWLAVLAATLPVWAVVTPGRWTAGVLFVPALVLLAGFAARRRGLAAVAVTAVETGVWLLLLTLAYLRPVAIAGVIPTPAAVARAGRYVLTATDHIQTGVAPLQADVALSFCLVAAVGALTVLVDHIAITTRLPLLAAVGLLAVSLIPTIAVPSAFDMAAFMLLAAAVLFLLRAETRTRFPPSRAASARPGSTSAIAVSIGLVTILVAVAVTPLLPQPPARAGGAGASRIDASLDLGRDLRRPHPVTTLTLTTDASSAPYLRVATLSRFTGDVWRPDATATAPLKGGTALDSLPTTPGVATEAVTTRVRVNDLTSRYLPVPYAATGVTGLPHGWDAMNGNRTVIGKDVATQDGMTYTVHSTVAVPTLEQIRASDARETVDASGVPKKLPPIIAEDARKVTAGTHDDYDALLALQDWLRGPEFTYSLTTPARRGYDASGAQDVADFLRVRSGYCIHFASAFALMARSLGLNARIVVGYLPGSLESTPTADGQAQYRVSSSQLHSWDEVFFSGIGWVPFDPTKSQGTPTSFLPATTEAGAQQPVPSVPQQHQQLAPTTAPQQHQAAGGQARAGEAATADTLPLPWLAVPVVIVLLLLLPMLVAGVRRRRHDAQARAGDVLAAWAVVQATAVDLRIPVPAGESARQFARRLVHAAGAPPGPTKRLLTALEQSAYAPPGTPVDGDACADAARAVRIGLLLAAPKGTRARVLLWPRSLMVRPGSAYARSGTPARTR